jgi:hypothetical protein
MATADKPPAVPAEDLAALDRTIQDLMRGVRDPGAMDRAAREMDEAREEIRERLVILDLAVELTERDEFGLE